MQKQARPNFFGSKMVGKITEVTDKRKWPSPDVVYIKYTSRCSKIRPIHENLHKLKFYPSVLLLMIKMSQSAREKLDSYCKNKV